MSTTKYNLKNPGVKRIMQEAKELANESAYEYAAHPLEDNIFEWHFTVRGPKDTDFEDGRYHGRIILPSEYPFKPPELIFLTPNGRFELNKKICLSITGFHPEFWQPAWGIRTVLLAVIGFFPTEAKGAIGGLDYTVDERKSLAKKSIGWECPVCHVNTKDALGNTPPNTLREEELPDFMISYKPSVAGDEKDAQKNPRERGSASSTATDVNTNNVNEAHDKAEIDRNHSSSSANMVTKEILKQEATLSNVNQHAATTPSTSAADDGSSTRAQRQEYTTNSSTIEQPIRSPLWLDALIAGLLSMVVTLIVRKYIF